MNLTNNQKIILENQIKKFKHFVIKNQELKESKKPQIIEPRKYSRTQIRRFGL